MVNFEPVSTYTHQQAADNLGISLSAIGRWVRAERGSTTDGETKEVVLNLADKAELVRLHRENEQLRMEREIIKKAAGDSLNINKPLVIVSTIFEQSALIRLPNGLIASSWL